MPADGHSIVRRLNQLKEDAQNFFSRWDVMAPFISPSRVGILSKPSPGTAQTNEIYDSTTIFAADLLAKFISSTVTNAATKWFSLRMRDEELNQLDDVKEWLEECRDRMLLELSRSNFYAEVSEMYADYGGFGTGSLLCVEDLPNHREQRPGFRGLLFLADRVGRYVIAENAKGVVDTHMSEHIYSARAAVEKFGQENLPTTVKQCVGPQPDKLFTFIHSIHPRMTNDGPFGAKNMPFASVYLELETKQVVMESGFEEFPRMCPRWQKTPGESYGRGPGDTAFPDTMTINKAKEMGFRDWALKIEPPIMVANDSVVGGTLNLVPAGPTSIDTQGRDIRSVIMPWETGSSPEVSQIKEEELRRSIRQIYFVDQILSLLEIEKTQMTAYEFQKKFELMNQILGPVYGRLVSEFLNPLIDRIFNIMLRAGAFSQPPDVLLELGGDIDALFESPLARAQKAAEVEAIERFEASLERVIQVYPQVVDNIDFDKAAQKKAEIYGVPSSIMRSDDQVNEIRADRAEQEAAEKQAQDVAMAAEAAGKAAPVLKALQPAGKAA